MSHHRRLSQSLTGNWGESTFQPAVTVSSDDQEDWLATWRTVLARDLIDSRIVIVDAESSVERACDIVLSEDIPCLLVKSAGEPPLPTYGLFDFADVNAFLTLAATRHTSVSDEPDRQQSRLNEIVAAAKAGPVPVHLVSNLSEKNPLEVLPYNATLVSILAIFALGAHRALIQSQDDPQEFIGMVSDHRLLNWFASFARETPSFLAYLSHPIQALSFPSLHLYSAVVASTACATVLDAMKLMSDQGVSSIAVLDDENGTLLSAVSVTDIAKVVVPSQSNQILTTQLKHLVSQIKDPDGSADGADKYPVYSVSPSSLLSFTIEKLLATNAHRVFVTAESGPNSPSHSNGSGNLTGIVSIVDILALFARLAKLPNVDPTSMQRHRRASSASSQSSISDRDLFAAHSRSNSKTSIRRSSSVVAASPPAVSTLDAARSGSIVDPLQRKGSRKSVRKEGGFSI